MKWNTSAITCRKDYLKNTAASSMKDRKVGHELAEYESYHNTRGLRWPVINGKETLWRYREGYDPYVKAGEGR